MLRPPGMERFGLGAAVDPVRYSLTGIPQPLFTADDPHTRPSTVHGHCATLTPAAAAAAEVSQCGRVPPVTALFYAPGVGSGNILPPAGVRATGGIFGHSHPQPFDYAHVYEWTQQQTQQQATGLRQVTAIPHCVILKTYNPGRLLSPLMLIMLCCHPNLKLRRGVMDGQLHLLPSPRGPHPPHLPVAAGDEE